MTNTSHEVLRQKCHNVLDQYGKFVFGYQDIGTKLLTSTIVGGTCHILTEGVPGLAKTHGVKVMSRCISDMTAQRIQFTPDLMPKEISGSKTVNLATREVDIEWGPILGSNFLIADEINRGKTNTQAALLEAMGEGQVTVNGVKKRVENPFVVMATQNPIEQMGTNPLPEAQHDRFMFKATFDYVGFDEELMILEHPELTDPSIYDRVEAQMSKADILATRAYIAGNINVSRTFNEYLLKVCRTTRPGKPEFEDFCKSYPKFEKTLKLVQVGVGPRALQALQRASMVQAFLFGKDPETGEPRNYADPEDLKAMVHSVLRHRIIMKDEASYLATGKVTSDDVISAVLDSIIPYKDPSLYKTKA